MNRSVTADPSGSSTHILNERTISFIFGSDVSGSVSERCFASSLSVSAHCFATQEVVVAGCSTSSHFPCCLPTGTGESGKSFSSASTSGCHASQVGPSSSPLLPHHGYVRNRPYVATCLELGGLDSVNMTACLTNEHAHSVMNFLNSFRGKTAILLEQFQRLLLRSHDSLPFRENGDSIPRWSG